MSDVGFPGPIVDTPEPETSIRFAIDQLEALDKREVFTEVPTCLLEGITHLLKKLPCFRPTGRGRFVSKGLSLAQGMTDAEHKAVR